MIDNTMPHKKAHLFVCVNGDSTREGTCGFKGAAELHKQVKDACKDKPWSKDVRINRSYCLGQCEHGIAAVLYPQDHWMLNMRNDDVAILVDAVKAAAESIKDH
jgi:(2Fe-2S) ferredoxin